MDDLPLDDPPSDVAPDGPHAQSNAPSSAPENLDARGAVAASQSADLWGRAADFNSRSESSQTAPSAGASLVPGPFASVAVTGASAAASASPFDAFDAFASPPSTMALPLPMENTVTPSLGSPLISFSPFTNTEPAASSHSSSSTSVAVAAVDDLLSFSPIAAPAPMSSASVSSSAAATASFMMMDDLFLSAPSSSSSSSSSNALHATTTTTPSAPLSGGFPISTYSTGTTTTTTSSTAMRGSFSGFDAASATLLDVITDYSVPQSAPAAFHDGLVGSGLEDLQRPTSEAEAKEIVHEGMLSPTEAERSIVASMVMTSPRPLSIDGVEEVEAYASPSQVEPSEIMSEHAVDETHAFDDQLVRESEVPMSSVQSADELPVASAWESEVVVKSASPVASPGAVEAQETDAHAPSSASIASAESARAGIEVTTGASAAVVMESLDLPESSEHGEEIDQDEDDKFTLAPLENEELAAATNAVVELTSQSNEAAHDELNLTTIDVDDARSATLDGIPSPASETEELEGFQALSGDSDEEEEAFHAEASAVYAEVIDTEDEADRASVDAGESLLHLHLREIAAAEITEPSVSSPAVSVTSSTGSSVAGSAFAFISAEASSPFSFGQTPQSPSAQEEEDVGDAEERSSSVHADEVFESTVTTTVHTERVDSEASTHRVDAVGDFEVSAGLLKSVETVDFGEGDSTVVDSEFQSSSLPSSIENEANSSSRFAVTEDGDFRAFGPPATAEEDKHIDSKEEDGAAFGGFAPSAVAVTTDDGFGGFGGFGQSAAAQDDNDDDDFGGFAASKTTTTANDDEDDDFGDFGSGTAWGSASTKDANDDFDDFTPAPAAQQWGSATTASSSNRRLSSTSSWATPAAESQPPPPPLAAPTDLNEFFSSAFPACKAPVAASLLPKPSSFQSGSYAAMSANSVLEQSSALQKSFHASLREYRSMLTGDSEDSHNHQQPSFESEALRLKYLKYVLTEKLSEASRHDGVFPQGSEKYQLFEAISDSGHEKNMREALASLQEALFQSSMNEAVMRIARQAALSAKARIAEQAAHQQSHGRGSLLATTRNFLSRSSGEKDHASRTGSSGSLGVLTPNSAAIQKGARFPSSGQEGEPSGNSSGYGSGEDTGSDVSVGDGSSYSEGDLTGNGSGPPSASGSSARSGGLMKKFHERFSSLSSSTKHKPRTVSLRRMGQSSEDVCKMELNMESISGGFDEVKWRCAGFLYETDEVARVAPSQIKIYAYPSNQLLTGKSDRSVLSKFFKPGTVWSIDIGVAASE